VQFDLSPRAAPESLQPFTFHGNPTGSRRDPTGDKDLHASRLKRKASSKASKISSEAGGSKDPSETTQVLPALVVDGFTLHFALEHMPEEFLSLAAMCRSVVCCRMSPLQKAEIVKLVKNHLKKIVLSIGDGANDVNMIQVAHVGVGIVGKEGTQAARAADFAIGEFRLLQRLLCIHGRFNYVRTTKMIQWFFYKNLAFTFGQFFFSFCSGWYGTTLHDGWILSLYNVLWTSMPPMAFGIFERDLRQRIITNHPELYREYQDNLLFNPISALSWFASAFWVSSVCFFSSFMLFYNTNVLHSLGFTDDLALFSIYNSSSVIIAVNLRAALETNFWTVYHHISIWGSIAVYLSFLCLYSSLLSIEPEVFGIFYEAALTPAFWLYLVLAVTLSLLPDFCIKHIRRRFAPADWQLLQEMYHYKVFWAKPKPAQPLSDKLTRHLSMTT